MRVFALKSCDTCRKAIGDLRAAGHAPQIIDIRADGISAADLAAMIDAFGDGAINRASATWRGLAPEERARDIAALLADHPTLLKRPVIQTEAGWTQGWGPAVRQTCLQAAGD